MVKLQKEDTIQFLRVNEIDGMLTVKVLDSSEQKTKFGKRPYLDIELPNKEVRRLFLNKKNIAKLVDLGIDDTEKLHGQQLILYKAKGEQ